MKKLFITLSLVSATLAGCTIQPIGHRSADSHVASHTIQDHKLYLIAEIPKDSSSQTGEVSSEKAEIYREKHQKTVICDRHHYYAASSADLTAQQTQITLVSGEKVIVAKPCFIENANPINAIYVAKNSIRYSN